MTGRPSTKRSCGCIRVVAAPGVPGQLLQLLCQLLCSVSCRSRQPPKHACPPPRCRRWGPSGWLGAALIVASCLAAQLLGVEKEKEEGKDDDPPPPRLKS